MSSKLLSFFRSPAKLHADKARSADASKRAPVVLDDKVLRHVAGGGLPNKFW